MQMPTIVANSKKKIVIPFLMGPTASGKTALSVELSKDLNAEIISVDSALIYRGMDIGTGKPSQHEQATVPHHLIDIRNPTEAYSAAEFCQDVTPLLDAIIGRGKLPLLVGGTMLYFKALQAGLSPLPPANPALRKQLEEKALEIGWAAMHVQLQELDKSTADKIHPNDPQRIQRALEVILLTGKPFSELKNHKMPLSYPILPIALFAADRSLLHERIKVRFEQMISDGFIAEVEGLLQRYDLHPTMPAMRAVGYRQIIEYLRGTINYNDMIEQALGATRQLAKRQETWLRKWPALHRFDMVDNKKRDSIMKLIHHSIACS